MTKNYHEINYKTDNKAFAKECAECHNLFSPTFMTKEMWKIALEDKKRAFQKKSN